MKRLLQYIKSLKLNFQKGQSLVFFAVSLPFLVMFVGAAADFGWLYLNQSRLQNAADAAATAGAAELIEDEHELSDYTYTTFVANSDEGLQSLVKDEIISNRSTATGDNVAQKYAQQNLNAWLGENVNLVENKESAKENEVKFQKTLYGKNTEDYSALYYTVVLSEHLNHLFPVMDKLNFLNLQSRAMAAVKVTHVFERKNEGNRLDLFTQMKNVEITETYPNWDEIQLKKGTDTEADKRSVLTCGNYYKTGNNYKTEVSLLNGWAFQVGSSRIGKPYRYGEDAKQTKKDDLFIDFQAELSGATHNKDWDLQNFDTAGGSHGYTWLYGDTPTEGTNFYRIHVPIEVADVYPISEHNTDTIQRETPDPLYAFIEQDTIAKSFKRSDGKNFNRNQMNSVRQLIINVAVTNTQKDSNGEYKNRPIVFFYEGPEKADPEDVDAGGKHIRDSKPVILNLFADFRGIVFAPNSPICINGNGFKWEGFAVGSDFCKLKTDFVAVTYDRKTYYVNKNNLKYGSKHNGNKYVTWKKENYYVNEVHLRRATDSDYDKYQYPYTVKMNGEIYYLDSIYNLFTAQNQDNDVAVKYNGRNYYIPKTALLTKVKEEAVTFLEDATINLSSQVANFNGKKAITYSDKTVTCQLNEMYIDQRGEVQFAELDNVSNADGSITSVKVPRKDENHSDYVEGETVKEKPLYSDNDAEDPHYYNYKIFNLHKDSRYASFLLVKLPNYNYLALNDLKGNNSRDMFFTTPRSKWVD